jgi:hypothetical protein
VLALVFSAVVLGCGKDPQTKPRRAVLPPANPSFVNGDGYVDLTWGGSPDAAFDDFRGYSVYRDTVSMEGLDIFQLHNRRLNPSAPVSGTRLAAYRDAEAVNGTKYIYRILAVKGGLYNEFSTAIEIQTAARPEFEADTLYEFQYAGRPCGLRLRDGRTFLLDRTALDTGSIRDSIDIYLGTTGSHDSLPGNLAIKSPHLLVRDQAAGSSWLARNADLQLLGPTPAAWPKGVFDSTGVTLDVVDLGVDSLGDGEVIGIRTPPEAGDFNYAKIQVLKHEGVAGERKVRLQVAYQARKRYNRF